jgi:glyoxylase-like metal-dependent hydrolase (beta-lactamase superfamily II)
MIIKAIPAGIYGANCYVICDEETMEAVVLDPGGDSDYLISQIDKIGAKVKYILLTHGHVDHVGGVVDLKRKYNVPFYIHKADEEMIMMGTEVFGDLPVADGYIKEGDIITFGNLKVKCIHTPGHTPGGVCFLIEDKVFTGDTLFQGSIGRTDFAGGSYEQIISSIVNKILPLGDNVEVYPGHGPKSSVIFEKARNPFLT